MIGPSDIRIVFSQIPATERVQNVQQQHPDLSQRQFALLLKEQQERKKLEVQDTERTEEEKISEDEKKDRQQNKQRSKPQNLQKGSDEEKEQNEQEPGQGKFIDIRI
ncbi:MAG: hypothetical protein JRI22_00085 [Deltaproteobacteria bacterium]|nr:hypothetical protein [Deltaproteobacteria bacterium]